MDDDGGDLPLPVGAIRLRLVHPCRQPPSSLHVRPWMTTTATSLSLLAPSASASSTRACPPTPPASIVSPCAAMDDDGGILPLPVGAIRLRLVLPRRRSRRASPTPPPLRRGRQICSGRRPAGEQLHGILALVGSWQAVRTSVLPRAGARVWRWWAAMAYRTSPTVPPHLAGLLPTSRPTSAELACSDLVDRGDFDGARRVADAVLAAAGPRGEVSDRLVHHFARTLLALRGEDKGGHSGDEGASETREAMAGLDRDVLLCCTDDRAHHTVLSRPGCSPPAIDVERRGERK
uniref:Uncharacterized protein n=1 Tax=Oryza nivara TaxID=4536 RepID=A0A0E0J6N1_ORYNI